MIPQMNIAQTPPADYQAFLDALPGTDFEGDIAADFASRLVSATDNSIYQVLPAAVLYPKDEADVARVLTLAAESRFDHVRFSARGAGTGTNGQSLSPGIILDCARHMTQVLEINLEEEWVRVQPGLIRDHLNEALKEHGYFFAPTLSPTNRATLGGMINTDACGKGSRVYGRTSNHVLGLGCVLSDGSILDASPLEKDGLTARKQRDGREGQIFQLIDDIVTEKADLIDETFPKMRRFLTGYNLAHVYDEEGHFHLEQIICGSEGSLAVVTEARLRITKIPPYTMLVATKYAGFNEALADAMALLASEPTAIETVDEKILELARGDAIYHRIKDYIADEEDNVVRTVNLVEYSGYSKADLEAKVDKLKAAIEAGETTAFGYFATTDPQAMGALWDLRKKGVGLLGNMPGDRKPIAFVEDTAVPPENLAAYIAEFRALLDKFGLQYAMYGHVDVGCLHVRPALDMRQERDAAMVRELSDAVMALVRKHGGIMWAEHGKGFRSEYTPLFFGEELYRDLRRIKETFDPLNKMNPGKVVMPLSSDEETVKIEAPIKGGFDRQVHDTDLAHFDPVFGCNGNGVCFNGDVHHIMCPSSKVTRNRIHSPKGRAALLREWLRRLGSDDASAYDETSKKNTMPSLEFGKPANGIKKWFNKMGSGDDFSHQVREAMGGCLSCKACATQCPIHVDIPEYKASFLELYHTRYPRSLRDYLVAFLEKGLPLQSKFPNLVNGVMSIVPDAVMGKVIGLVDAPKLATDTPSRVMRRKSLSYITVKELDRLDEEVRKRTVLMLPDAFSFYYDPNTFWGTFNLLEHLGFLPRILPFKPNGKPMHIKGFVTEFKQVASDNDAFFAPFGATGLPVICVEPSIAITWRDEYKSALGRNARMEVSLVQEWLSTRLDDLKPFASAPAAPYYLLGHCMERTAQLASGDQWAAIFKALGFNLEVVGVGCCGMAGTFGHEVEHVDESRGIFQMSWEKRIASLDQEHLLVTGYSCRTQAKRFAHLQTRHPAVLLWQLMK